MREGRRSGLAPADGGRGLARGFDKGGDRSGNRPLLRVNPFRSILWLLADKACELQECSGMPLPLNLQDLGRRVRAIRTSKGLTLEEVVARAEFTASWLSKLENGQMTPSLDGLVRLSHVLDCGVEELVEGLSSRPRHVLVKRGRGRHEASRDRHGDLRLEHLAEEWRGRSMVPVVLHVGGGRAAVMSHDGERFLMPLDGHVAVDYGDDRMVLGEGDSLYIDAKIPHGISAVGRSKVRVLSISAAVPAALGSLTKNGRRKPGSR